MNSREAVFASIRRSLGVHGDEATRRFEVETRLKQAPPGVIPKRGAVQPREGSRLRGFLAWRRYTRDPSLRLKNG